MAIRKFQLERLIRPNVAAMRTYTPARSEFNGPASIYLDANENPRAIIEDSFEDINRYPDPLQREVKERIAQMRGIRACNVFLGNGSDEAIDLLMRVFARPGRDRIAICEPSYRMYEVLAALNDLEVVRQPLGRQFGLCSHNLLRRARGCRMLFLCSPNNPTGNCLDDAEVRRVIRGFDGIVVIDEAYIEYTAKAGLAKLVRTRPNLVVLQTFSKAWGLAGARIGICISSKEIVFALNRVKIPYNVGLPAQQLALAALRRAGRVRKEIMRVQRERARLTEALETVPGIVEVFPSESNFILVRMRNARRKYEALVGAGIMVRDVSGYPRCGSCLRITIGTRKENDVLLRILRSNA